MEFFREAPLGAIVLVVIGAILAVVVSTPMQIRAARRKAARADRKGNGCAQADPIGRRDTRGARREHALMAIGFAIWIFDL